MSHLFLPIIFHVFVVSAESSPVDESYLNIKMDDVTKQYMIGSPVRADGTDTVKKWRSCKANYSLSDNHVLEERGTMTVFHSRFKTL